MQSDEIRLQVPKETAAAFLKASPDERRRIQEIVRLAIEVQMDEGVFQEATARLDQTVQEISEKAAERGATQAIVDKLLNDS